MGSNGQRCSAPPAAVGNHHHFGSLAVSCGSSLNHSAQPRSNLLDPEQESNMASDQQFRSRQIAPPYRRLFRQLHHLNLSARLAVCVFMSELVNGDQVAALINRIARQRSQCPNCEGPTFYRHGFANGLQRYRCRSCGVTFNGLTGTPLARLRLKHRWLAYCDCLRDPGCTVHNAAQKVGVHPNTSFRWRHRFLSWTKLDRPSALQGVAEADETCLRESEKGTKQLQRKPRRHGGAARNRGFVTEQVNIVVARDRSGKTVDFVAGKGALEAAALKRHLLPKLAPDVILMSDANAAYKSFARQAHIRHEVIHLSQDRRVPGAVHIQNVNAYQGRFHTWLRHFNGVATRYLENYLGWRWAIDLQRIDTAHGFLRAALGAFNS
jgi:transposase-like protein